MRIRRVLIALFALGTVGGYGAGLASSSCHAHARRAAWERHVAQLCADAARNPGRADTRGEATDDDAYP